LRPVFSASRMQQVSDLHLKFALRPHHVWKYGRREICDSKEKKDRRKKNKRQDENIYGLPYYIRRS